MARGRPIERVHRELIEKRDFHESRVARFTEALAAEQAALERVKTKLEVFDEIDTSGPRTNGTRRVAPRSKTPQQRKRMAEALAKTPPHSLAISKKIRDLVAAEPGALTRQDILNRLEHSIQSTSRKPVRRIISNRISLMYKRGQLIESNGKMLLGRQLYSRAEENQLL